MAASTTHLIAQALLRLAESIPSERARGESVETALTATTEHPVGSAPNIENIAMLIRALCPAASERTSVTDVASLIRTLSPAEAARADPVRFAEFLRAISPADEADGWTRLRALIAALSPAEPEQRITDLTAAVSESDLGRSRRAAPAEVEVQMALLSLPRRSERESVPSSQLGSQQRQAIDVFRVLWPSETQPQMSVEDAAAFLRALCPADQPAEDVAALIAALSPASDKTISGVDNTVRFLRLLSPAIEKIPAEDVAPIIRALSPPDEEEARGPDKAAALIRALCPDGSEPSAVAALIRGLCPADDPMSDAEAIAQLIRELSTTNLDPVQVLRILSPGG